MHTSPFKLCMGALVLSVFGLTAVRAETAKLDLKRLADQGRMFPTGDDALYRMIYPQGYSMSRDAGEYGKEQEKEFAKVIKKQPEKYLCAFPFRGVAKFGSQKFGFVFDSKKLSLGYNLLHFDLNGNGDLTDDKVVEARSGGSMFGGGDYANREFPRVDLTIDVEGKKLEYSFFATVYSYGLDKDKGPQHASASFGAAVYRQGEITLDGKQHHLALLDFNSSGRFSDPFEVNKDSPSMNGQLYPTQGDILLVDPDMKNPGYGYGLTDRKERMPVSKLVCIEGKYYELKVAPTGEELTVTPYKGAVAAAVNMNCDQYDAVIYGDGGMLKFGGEKNKPAMLPVGEWRVLSYQTVASPVRLPETKPAVQTAPAADKSLATKPADEQKPRPKSALAKAIRSWLGSSDAQAEEEDEGEEETPAFSLRGRLTLASGAGTKDAPPFKVEAGRTAVMKFGPPYKPTVRTEYYGGDREIRLSLAIVGSGGELLSDLVVNGSRPNAPSFQVISPAGEIILRGKFEFG